MHFSWLYSENFVGFRSSSAQVLLRLLRPPGELGGDNLSHFGIMQPSQPFSLRQHGLSLYQTSIVLTSNSRL